MYGLMLVYYTLALTDGNMVLFSSDGKTTYKVIEHGTMTIEVWTDYLWDLPLNKIKISRALNYDTEFWNNYVYNIQLNI